MTLSGNAQLNSGEMRALEKSRDSTCATVARRSRRNSILAKNLGRSYTSRKSGQHPLVSIHANDMVSAPTRPRGNMNVPTAETVSRVRMRQNDIPTQYTTTAPHGPAHCSALSTEPSMTQSHNPARPTLVGFVASISTGQAQRSTLDTPQTKTGRSALPTFGSSTTSVNATSRRSSTAPITFACTSNTRMRLYLGTGRRNWRKFVCRRSRYQRMMSYPVVEHLNPAEIVRATSGALCRRINAYFSQVRKFAFPLPCVALTGGRSNRESFTGLYIFK